MPEDTKKAENKQEEKKEEAESEKPEETSADKDKVRKDKTEEKQEAETADADSAVDIPEKFKTFIDGIKKMSVLELHELVKTFEKAFGVSAAAVAVASAGAGGAESGEEAKSSFGVELKEIGDQKIAVIKAVKEILGLGLKEAKDLVEGAPSMLKENVAKEEAESMKKKIEDAGGSVELK